QKQLGIIFIDTGRLGPLEEEYGWEVIDQLLNRIRVFLDSLISSFQPFRLFSIHRVAGEHFLLVLSSSDPDHTVTYSQLSQVSNQLEEQLNRYLASHVAAAMAPYARMFNGCSILQYNSNVRFERLVA